MSTLIDRLEVRDREILRTLARLRYVTVAELVGALVPSTYVARRRLRRLAGFNLVAVHTRGLPTAFHYQAWRLADSGLDVVHRLFPDELLPDGLAERLEGGSLANAQHREAVNALYLRALAHGVAPPGSDHDLDAARANARAQLLKARADQLAWSADGDVVLRYKKLDGKEEHVVPDATAVASAFGARVFVELDRSHHATKRIADSLARYKRYLRERYAHDYPDGHKPTILLVTPSEARRASLTAVAARVFGAQDGTCRVVTSASGPSWLAQATIHPAAAEAAASAPSPTAPSTAAATRPALASAARDVYAAALEFRTELKPRGLDLPSTFKNALRALHHALQPKEDSHA